jgi:hypothetical protein
MSLIDNNAGHSRPLNGTATTATGDDDVDLCLGNMPAGLVSIKNLGPSTLWFSIDGGNTWQSIEAAQPFVWQNLWTIRFKTLAGTADYQVLRAFGEIRS